MISLLVTFPALAGTLPRDIVWAGLGKEGVSVRGQRVLRLLPRDEPVQPRDGAAASTGIALSTIAIWPESGYVRFMPTYSVVEAKNNLSSLIEQAERGEQVVITRHGLPVVSLHPVVRPRTIDRDFLDWLAKRREGRGRPIEDGATQVRRMRDEGP